MVLPTLLSPDRNLHTLFMTVAAFGDGLIDNDEKVASTEKTYSIQDQSATDHTLFMTKMAKIYHENHNLRGRTYLLLFR